MTASIEQSQCLTRTDLMKSFAIWTPSGGKHNTATAGGDDIPRTGADSRDSINVSTGETMLSKRIPSPLPTCRNASNSNIDPALPLQFTNRIWVDTIVTSNPLAG